MSIKSDQSPGLDGGPGADKDYFQYLKAVVKGRNDPVWFAREILGVDLFPVQEELLREFYQDLYDPSLPQRKVFILEAGMRCVTGDTLITTNKGIHPIKDIFTEGIGQYSFKGQYVDTRNGYKTFTNGIYQDIQDTIRITTRYGYSVAGSYKHPVLVMDKNGKQVWKKLPDIQKGEYICISRNETELCKLLPDIYYDRHLIDGLKLARLLGLLVGDGTYTSTHKASVSYTSEDDELKLEFKYLIKTLFDKECVEYGRESSNTVDISVFSKKIRDYLYSLGLDYHGSYDKCVPSYILTGPKELIRHFLQGLFDTDGYILNNGSSVHLDCTSEELIKQVQYLLLQFGIISSRQFKTINYIRKNGQQSSCWTLTLYHDSARLFVERIGFRLGRKIRTKDDKTTSQVDKIPHLHTILREMKGIVGNCKCGDNTRIVWEKIRHQCYNNLRTNSDKPSGITYSILNDIIAFFEPYEKVTKYVNYLKELQDGHLFYDEIVSIEYGKEPVYDLCVPDGHEFLTNGIVSHNSGKTAIASIIACFEFFQLITMENPSKHYGLLRNQPIFISVVATSSKIAEDGVFQNTINMLEGSDWFQTWFPEIHPTGEKIEYKTKTCHVAVRYLGSWANTAVGRTNKCVIMDELDLFEDTNGKRGAWEMWTRLRKSTATLHRDGHVMGLSSPKRANGIIRTLRLNGEREPDMCLARMYKTWEMNPNITDEELREEFKNDMASYYRDFACQPEIAGGLQFPEKVVLTPMINVLTAESYVDNKRVSRVMAIDPAVKNDGFGVACGYMDTYGNIVIDGVFKFTKKEGDAYIKPSDVRAFIYEKIPKLMVNEFIFDTWMFPDIIEDLKTKFGIEATKHIVRKEDYDRWRGMQTNPGTTKLTVVDDDELEREANTLIVTRTESGIPKTDHVYGGSKDCADCVANVIWYLVTGGDDKDKKVKIPRLVAIQAF